MATAVNQLSEPSKTVPDILGNELFLFLQRRAKLASMPWEDFLFQLVDVHKAETRFEKVKRISKWREERERRKMHVQLDNKNDVHRTNHQLSADQVQRIIFLAYDADPPLPLEVIAERFCCSPSTIHRMLARHKRLHRMAVRGPNAGRGGNNNFLYGR
jgi:hypothetical protein